VSAMSQLFAPFRAIGVVCDDVPAAVQQRGTETFVAVAIGRSFQLFGCARLNLLFAGPMLRHRIRALAMHGDLTFAASGSDVFAFRRGRQVAVYNAVGRVALLLVLGNHVLSIRRSGHVDVWDTAKGELWRSFRLSSAVSEPTACCHPPTYLNKVLIGGSTGVMELWNVRTQTCVYSFRGWGSAITVVQPSPAVRSFRRRSAGRDCETRPVCPGLSDCSTTAASSCSS
jgi:U3 small nucleolar RNA-associated protein 21